MRTTDLADLLKAVESIRSEMHPDLNPDFLKAVIAAEEENPEDDEGAIHAIRVALNAGVRGSGVT